MRRWKGSEEVAAAAKEAGRKRKSDTEYSPKLLASSVQLKTQRLAPANSENLTCETTGGEASPGCWSSSRSRVTDSKFVDLEHEDEDEVAVEFLTESAGDSVDVNNSTCPSQQRVVKQQSYLFRSDKTPLTAIEVESTAAAASESNSPRRCTAEKTPTVTELQNFFAAAEKDLHKQFIDKYNYDIVEDKPLEGQYEWVQIQLKPRAHDEEECSSNWVS